MYTKTFRIFGEKELDNYLHSRIQGMQNEILGNTDDYILNVNETEYVSYLFDKFTVENVDLQFDKVHASTSEKSIPAEMFPGSGFDFIVEPGHAYLKTVVKYHIPFTGPEELLHYVPTSHIRWATEVSTEDGCVCFEVIDFYQDAARIKGEADPILAAIKQQLGYMLGEIGQYNSSLRDKVQQSFANRKRYLINKNNLLANLGVPIKNRDNFPQTFAIPTLQTRKKIRVSPPVVNEKEFRPEPTLDSATYQDILQVINDVGKQFERMPSTYANKSEEDLRDHILLVLEPRFEGTATGETFNKGGKTDILLRYEGSNAFIAECKFWKGEKAFLDTITQLLGYLTWRDSKSAVVIFVPIKGFSSVIKTVEEGISKHSNYLGFVDRREDTWLNYRFHTNGDPNREVKLAVLLFHVPHG